MAARDNSLDPSSVLDQFRPAAASNDGVPTNGNPDGPAAQGGGVQLDAPAQAPPAPAYVPEAQPPQPVTTRPEQPMQIGQGRVDVPVAPDAPPPPEAAPVQPMVAQPAAGPQKPDNVPFAVFERQKKDWQESRDRAAQLEAQNQELLDYYRRVEPTRQAWEAEWPKIQGLQATAAQQKQELEIEKATNAYINAEWSAGRTPDVEAFVRQKRTDLLLQQAVNLPQTVEQVVTQRLNGILENRDAQWQQQSQFQAQQQEQARRHQVVSTFETQWEQIEIANPEIAGNAGWKQAAFLQWAQGDTTKPVNDVMSQYLRGVQSQRVAAMAAQPPSRAEVHAALPRLSTGGPGPAAQSAPHPSGISRPPKQFLLDAVSKGESPIAASARWHRNQLTRANAAR